MRIMSFGSVNRYGQPGFNEAMAKHHLLVQQLHRRRQLHEFLIGLRIYGFATDDFRANGILLPITERDSDRYRLPLHRGSHRHYNAQVIALVEAVRRASVRIASAHCRGWFAVAQLNRLQSALRRTLQNQGPGDIDAICLSGLYDPALVTAGDESVKAACIDKKSAARRPHLLS